MMAWLVGTGVARRAAAAVLCVAALAVTLAAAAAPVGMERYANPLALLKVVPDFTVETYKLAPGDTISAVAKTRGVTVDTILSFNRILAPRYLKAGQEIAIPSSDGYLVNVPSPTPAADLVGKYRVRADLFIMANRESIRDGLVEGDVFLPGADLDPAQLREAMGDVLCWPTVSARISSRFGKRADPFTGAASSHKGLDIAARYGSPVFAALNGTVTETGTDSVLGKYIKIDHGKGVRTTYGHLSQIQIKRGAVVERGQAIGKVGSTGYSTGPHLHFVVYKNGRIVNPLTMTN